jgi:hypothetical protein
LIEDKGIIWTTRIMGFVAIAIFFVSFVLILYRGVAMPKPTSYQDRPALFDRSALTDKSFWTFTIAMSVLSLVYWVPYYFLPTYVADGLGLGKQWGSRALIIAQASSIIGRIGSAVLATKHGSMIPWVSATTLCGIICMGWIRAMSLKSVVVVCVFWGKQPRMCA